MAPYKNLQEFLDKRAIPEPNSGCWFWMGALTTGDYPAGQAHRRAYRLSGKKLVKGLELDHLCRVRFCINPDHLEQVTRLENHRRSPFYTGYKTHCVHGHSLANCLFTKDGRRRCRTCNNEKHAAYLRRERAAGRARR